jgi:galactan endo-1,6-beta-galactosidase
MMDMQSRRALSAVAVFCAISVCAVASPAQQTEQGVGPAGYTLIVDKDQNRGTWEGWGCSLAWWGRALGNAKYQELYADLFFTQKTVLVLDRQLPGLGLNIIRYNIGGGGRSDKMGALSEALSDKLPWYRDIDGFWLDKSNTDPNSAAWNWMRDSRQLAMMQAIVKRGADKVEFFSNAPMWWMSTSNSSAGGALKPEERRDFALYVATVVQRAQKDWGIKVDYITPLNEPSAWWWNFPKEQECCKIPYREQPELLASLREELDKRGLQDVAITASDENTMREARLTYEYFKTQDVTVNGQTRKAADLVAKVNVHGYAGLKPWRDNGARQALRASVGDKTLWQSEYCDGEGSGIVLAQTILEDLTYLRPTAWLWWQPVESKWNWCFVNAKFSDDSESGEPTWIYTKHYVFAQFTRFVRPGDTIVGSSDPNSVVAYDQKRSELKIVTLNYGKAQPITYDLTRLSRVGNSAAVTTTNTNGSQLFVGSQVEVKDKRFTLDAPANTIYSTVIDGVAL